jgi:hypothetical protein
MSLQTFIDAEGVGTPKKSLTVTSVTANFADVQFIPPSSIQNGIFFYVCARMFLLSIVQKNHLKNLNRLNFSAILKQNSIFKVIIIIFDNYFNGQMQFTVLLELKKLLVIAKNS